MRTEEEIQEALDAFDQFEDPSPNATLLRIVLRWVLEVEWLGQEQMEGLIEERVEAARKIQDKLTEN